MLNTEKTVLLNLGASCTQEEAVAKMLGWLRGTKRLQTVMVTLDGISPNQLPHIYELPDPLAETIQEYREIARGKFLDAIADENFELAAENEADVERWDKTAELASQYMIDIADELAQANPCLRIDQAKTQATGKIHITLKSLHQWAYQCYGISILDNQPVIEEEPPEIDVAITTTQQASLEPTQKPWLIAEPNDPLPAQPWYTPARYFARQLIYQDATLLNKRPLLASKVREMLTAASFMKRGGVKPLDAATIQKAFSNVKF